MKFNIGDKVRVPCRFGETGKIQEFKDNKYGVIFKRLPFTLWYEEHELLPETGEGFSWFRMPQ